MHKAGAYILPVLNAIGDSHLPYPWEWHWREGGGVLEGGGGGGQWSKLCRRGEGLKVVLYSQVGS